jgi:hypothetical protein
MTSWPVLNNQGPGSLISMYPAYFKFHFVSLTQIAGDIKRVNPGKPQTWGSKYLNEFMTSKNLRTASTIQWEPCICVLWYHLLPSLIAAWTLILFVNLSLWDIRVDSDLQIHGTWRETFITVLLDSICTYRYRLWSVRKLKISFSMPPHVLYGLRGPPPGCGRNVSDFWGWDALEAQLRCPDEVDCDI